MDPKSGYCARPARSPPTWRCVAWRCVAWCGVWCESGTVRLLLTAHVPHQASKDGERCGTRRHPWGVTHREGRRLFAGVWPPRQSLVALCVPHGAGTSPSPMYIIPWAACSIRSRWFRLHAQSSCRAGGAVAPARTTEEQKRPMPFMRPVPSRGASRNHILHSREP